MVRLGRALVIVALLAAPAAATDTAITLTDAASVTARRTALITFLWGSGTLPTSQPSSVNTGITSPLSGLTNLLRVDQLNFTYDNGQTNVGYHFIPATRARNRMVVMNPGHSSICIWNNFDSGYRFKPTVQGLLSAGYAIFGFNMPDCGNNNTHATMVSTYGDAAIKYFVFPAVEAINYFQASFPAYTDYNFVGFSGGGWTGTLVAAIDTRIKVSALVAGSTPGVQFIAGTESSSSHGDAEQNYTPLYDLAGYLDLYILGAFGSGRRQLQILNRQDNGAFGQTQWNNDGFSAHYGQSWDTYIQAYHQNLRTFLNANTAGRYALVVDEVAVIHQISTFGLAQILNVLSPPSIAISGITTRTGATSISGGMAP